MVSMVAVNRDSQTFAATRPSAVLLEQLAVCVSRGEPVLLVGETGTGKTSTVQYLAKLTGELRLQSTEVILCPLWVHWFQLCLLSRTQVAGGEHEPTERHC